MWAGTLTVAAGHPIHDEPPDVGHAGVMVDVEEGDLMVVLPQDEEKGVHELDELGEVVPPEDMDDLGRDQTHAATQEGQSHKPKQCLTTKTHNKIRYCVLHSLCTEGEQRKTQ